LTAGVKAMSLMARAMTASWWNFAYSIFRI
jgi:hypothetical protein